MACLDRVSPTLKEIFLKLYRAEKAMEVDHHFYEFGCVEYHIQSSASSPPHVVCLSISTPTLSSSGISQYTIEMVKRICSEVVEIVEAPKEGYGLTLTLNLAKIPRVKDSLKIITKISTVESVILTSQLKEMLLHVNSNDVFQGMYKPIKLVYHPREPFFVIKQPQRIITVFPMRFKEKTDVIIATAFFQELMDVGNSEKFARAPPCSWSPIPPPELRGETLEDLNTNGGFVSFEISSRHVDGKRLDKTVWSLLNFYSYVKYHVKCTRGFIRRRMRKRLESLVELLHKTNSELEQDQPNEKNPGCGLGYMQRMVGSSRYNMLKRKWGNFGRKMKRINSRLRIYGFRHFWRRWLRIPKFSSPMGYKKLN